MSLGFKLYLGTAANTTVLNLVGSSTKFSIHTTRVDCTLNLVSVLVVQNLVSRTKITKNIAAAGGIQARDLQFMRLTRCQVCHLDSDTMVYGAKYWIHIMRHKTFVAIPL